MCVWAKGAIRLGVTLTWLAENSGAIDVYALYRSSAWKTSASHERLPWFRDTFMMKRPRLNIRCLQGRKCNSSVCLHRKGENAASKCLSRDRDAVESEIAIVELLYGRVNNVSISPR